MLKRWKLLTGTMAVVLAITGLAVVPALADRGEKLADELGITIEELKDAQSAAHDAAVQQALDEGLITEAQAARLLERSAAGFGHMRPGPGMHLKGGIGSGAIDHQALLANTLGITIDELQAAIDAAHSTQLAEAVAEGRITQEQADQMQAHRNLRQYMHQEEVQNTLRATYESVIAQAVADGVITQEQADTILENGPMMGPGAKLGGFGKMKGRPDGMHGGFGGMRGGVGGECGGPFGPDLDQTKAGSMNPDISYL